MAMTPQALTLLLLALTTAIPATSEPDVRVAAGGYILAECHQAAPNGSNAASSAFRAGLHVLLVALPSAAVPTGCASLHSDNGTPFVRGLCFDDSPPTGGCAGCLSWAAEKIADECGGSRCAGAWNAGCFVGYRDTNSSSPHEDAYRGRDFSTDGDSHSAAFYEAHELAQLALSLARRAAESSSGPMMATSYTSTGRKGTVRAVAHCARDVMPADCGRCLEESARELPRNCCGGGWALDGRREGVAVVAGFNCHLRLEIHAPDLPLGKMILKTVKENLAVIVILGTIIVTGVIAIILVRMFRPAQQHHDVLIQILSLGLQAWSSV